MTMLFYAGNGCHDIEKRERGGARKEGEEGLKKGA